ncbi:MAG: O-antigen ligase family protein [Patescibacteria group bacterium]
MKLNTVLLYTIILGLLSVVITPLIISGSMLFPFISGKAFFFRIVTEIVLVLWLILALRDPAYRPRASWILKSFAALIVVLILATILGVDPYHSFWSNYERMEGLIGHLHLFAYFLVLISIFKTEKLWSVLIGSSLVVNLIVNIYSSLQLLDKIKINQGGVRVDGTLGNAIYLAIYELFGFFILLLIVWRLYDRFRSSPDAWKKGGMILGLLLALFNLFIIYKTATRGVALGLVLGLLVAAGLFIWRERQDRLARRIAIGCLLVLALFSSSVVVFKDSNFIKQSPVLSRLASISISEGGPRFMIWQIGWQGFKERPVLGWGPENYMPVFNKYYNPKMYSQEQWFDRSHNIIFDWLVTTGLLGLLVYLSLFVAALYYLWWSPRAGLGVMERSLISGLLVAYLAQNIFVFDNLTSYLLFFGLLGYLHYRVSTGGAINESPKAAWAEKTFGPTFTISASSAGIILGVLALYFLNFKPILAANNLITGLSYNNEGQKKINEGKPQESLPYFERGLGFFEQVYTYNTFGSMEATEQLINFTIQTAGQAAIPLDLKQAIVNFAHDRIVAELERDPSSARMHVFAGSLYSRIGSYDEAAKELSLAREISPKKQTILFELGSLYFRVGKTPEALAVFKQAYELDPSFSEAAILYSVTAIISGQIDLAKEVINSTFADGVTVDDRLIGAYFQTNHYDEIVKLWEKKVAATPADLTSHKSLIGAYLISGRRDKAAAQAEAVIKLIPEVAVEFEQLVKVIRSGQKIEVNGKFY